MCDPSPLLFCPPPFPFAFRSKTLMHNAERTGRLSLIITAAFDGWRK